MRKVPFILPGVPLRPVEEGRPLLVVLAGPNGAGKTYFFEKRMAFSGLPFVNADLIKKQMEARGENVSDYEAAKIAETRRKEYVERRESFCFETVLSDKVGSKNRFFRDAQKSGYAVYLLFIGLDDIQVSKARVLHRVEKGGHDVPEHKLEDRFPRTFDNLHKAVGFVDQVVLIDNSSFDTPYRHVATCVSGQVVQLFPPVPPWARNILPKTR